MGTGRQHKLLAEFDGIPLVRRVAMEALGSKANAVVVVTGHRYGEVLDSLSGLHVQHAHNFDYESGIAGSLVAGILSTPVKASDGVVVMLADMPSISSADLDVLIEAFRSAGGGAIVRAASHGLSGNPVILPRALYGKLLRLRGDIGARGLIQTANLPIIDVEIVGDAALDVDTPEAVVAAGGVLRG
jgi:molybdenum cofactor cytidylyltransferase